jgi:hypothetical protein
MLFLLMMEVLNALIQRAKDCSLLQPLGPRCIPYRATLYMDDLVLFMRPLAQNLHVMRAIFGLFEGASGLG